MKILRTALLLVFGLLALLSLAYMVVRTLNPAGAIDFHAYWYAGQFLRQGTDPYTAFVNGETLNVPITYLDGRVDASLPVARPGLGLVPAQTAPLLELLVGFSFFSWPTSKLLWMVLNLALMILLPGWILRVFPILNIRPKADKLLFWLVFVTLFGTRNTIGNGQTGMVILAAMLLALLAGRRWIWAGLALGLALSKYSLALPLLILFLFEGKIRAIAVGLLVQVLAVFGLAAATHQPVLSILEAYVRIFHNHTDQAGIHLATLFPEANSAGWLAGVLVTLVTAGVLGAWFYRRKKWTSPGPEALIRLSLFSVLILWTLLVGYHREYDTLVVSLPLALIAEQIIWMGSGHPTRRFISIGLGSLAVVILSLPASGMRLLEPWLGSSMLEAWPKWQSTSVTIMLVLLLGLASFFLFTIQPIRGSDEHMEGSANAGS